MWNRGYGGYGACGYEPITKEEKIALLERKEQKLQGVLSHIQKIKESLKSGKPIEEDQGSDE